MIRTQYTKEQILKDRSEAGAPDANASVGYHSVKVAIRDNRLGTEGDHDSHTEGHRKHLINLSRAYKRDNPIYQGSVYRGAQFVVGSGFKLQLVPSDSHPTDVNQLVESGNGVELVDLQPTELEQWCQDREAEWSEWWGTNAKRRRGSDLKKGASSSWRRKRPDVKQILSGPRLEALAMREILTAGDMGVILLGEPGEERVQFVEAEQIAGERARFDDGIQKDSLGMPEKYFVCPYRSGQVDHKRKQSYTPDQFLFVTADPERSSGVRCVPPMQAAFSTLDRLTDICDAEAVAWQLQARMAVILNTEEGAAIDTGSREDPSSNDSTSGNLADRVQNAGLGLFFHALPGEDMKGFDRTAPGKNFGESFRELARIAGLPVNMALEFLLLDMTRANYSQTRALVALFVEWIVGYQIALSSQLHDPLFDWWLHGRIQGGTCPPPPGDFDVSWIYPSFPGIDLKAETEAWKEQIRLGIRSWSAAVKGANQDPDAVRKQKERDRIAAVRSALRVKAATGVETDWQGFCGEPIPGAAAASPSSDAKDADDSKEEDTGEDDKGEDQ